ncbi:LLM class flavin-dependent oxidoreductase [Okibacterium endophyticum]
MSEHTSPGATERRNERASAGASIGVMLPRDLPITRFIEFAMRSEELGFDEIWVVEDCFFRGGIAQAATVLAVTKRIRVGVGIVPAAVRNPAFTALEAATLAELHPGRIDFGIGHGVTSWMQQVGAWPSSPLTVLDETLSAVRRILAGEVTDADGRYVHLSNVQLESPPAQVPPVLAGVRGPKSLAVAGRSADGTILAEPVTPEYLRAAIRSIAAVGPHRVVAYNVAAVNDDPAEVRDTVRPALEWIGEPENSAHISPLPFAGELAELRAECATREEFARRLPGEWVDRLAVVGSADDARRSIRTLHEAGADSVVLIPAGPDATTALESLARVL